MAQPPNGRFRFGLLVLTLYLIISRPFLVTSWRVLTYILDSPRAVCICIPSHVARRRTTSDLLLHRQRIQCPMERRTESYAAAIKMNTLLGWKTLCSKTRVTWTRLDMPDDRVLQHWVSLSLMGGGSMMG